jgi:hypothetical protein
MRWTEWVNVFTATVFLVVTAFRAFRLPITPRKTFWLGTLAGAVVLVAVSSIREDIMGKEAYIAYTQEHWVSGKITIPLMVVQGAIMLFAALAVIWRTRASAPQPPAPDARERPAQQVGEDLRAYVYRRTGLTTGVLLEFGRNVLPDPPDREVYELSREGAQQLAIRLLGASEGFDVPDGATVHVNHGVGPPPGSP